MARWVGWDVIMYINQQARSLAFYLSYWELVDPIDHVEN
jgi:hypothetical protein